MTAPAIASTLSDFIAEAARLEHENQRLRELIGEILIWIAEREELLGLVNAELDRRELDRRAVDQ